MTYTPTERKIDALLSDGLWHARAEVKDCLWDEQSPEQAIEAHVSNLRKKLESGGHDIVGRNGQYRKVRLLSDPNDGRE